MKCNLYDINYNMLLNMLMKTKKGFCYKNMLIFYNEYRIGVF